MALQKHEDCPLCVDSQLAEQAWWSLQESGGNHARASETIENIDDFVLREHFKYHRSVQPAPKKQSLHKDNLKKAKRKGSRAQKIIILCARVPALSSSQLAEIFYWNGKKDQLSAARSACYRQLRWLLYSDMLYRLYPTKSARPKKANGAKAIAIYFLGRGGVALVEDREKNKLDQRQWITGINQVGEDWRLRERQENNEIVASLVNKIRQNNAVDIQDARATLTFSPLNWYADRRMRWTFKDPIEGNVRLYLGGLSAFGITFPEKKASSLLPFTYLYDSGSVKIETISRDLINYGSLERNSVMQQVCPDFPPGFVPVLLVVCNNARRCEELRKQCQKSEKTTSNKPLIIVTDKATFYQHGLRGKIWLYLWDKQKTPTLYPLIETLLRGSKKAPLKANHVLNIPENIPVRDPDAKKSSLKMIPKKSAVAGS